MSVNEKTVATHPSWCPFRVIPSAFVEAIEEFGLKNGTREKTPRLLKPLNNNKNTYARTSPSHAMLWLYEVGFYRYFLRYFFRYSRNHVAADKKKRPLVTSWGTGRVHREEKSVGVRGFL